MHEIAPLLAILEDQRLLAVQQARGEDRQDAGIGIGERLPRPIDVEQPQAHALHAIGRGHDVGRALLDIFVERVDRGEVRPLPFRRRDGGERTTATVDRFPVLLPVAQRLALGILDQRAVGIAIKALAIDAHRRGGDDAAHRPVDQRLEQHRGADVVGRGVAFHLVHRLPDADLGGEMDDAVDPIDRAGDRGLVANVAADQLGIGAEHLRSIGLAVYLLDEAIEHPHLVAARQKFLGHRAADETGPARDQYTFHSPPLTLAPDTCCRT